MISLHDALLLEIIVVGGLLSIVSLPIAFEGHEFRPLIFQAGAIFALAVLFIVLGISALANLEIKP